MSTLDLELVTTSNASLGAWSQCQSSSSTCHGAAGPAPAITAPARFLLCTTRVTQGPCRTPWAGQRPRVQRHLCNRHPSTSSVSGGKQLYAYLSACMLTYQHADGNTSTSCIASSIMERNFNCCCEYCW